LPADPATATSPAELSRQLRALGVVAGDVLVVHAAFSRVAPVEGGPRGLIDALQEAIGPRGTLAMPSMTEDDDAAFDARATPCRELGVLADTFWREPGVLRSDSPHAFAARGPRAREITAPHPADFPHGESSPIGRVHSYGGSVLLLGVDHDANTTIHLAEALVGVRYRLPKHCTLLRSGRVERIDYLEIDHCCERFALANGWLDAVGAQRCGRVGRAQAKLARSRDIVAAVCAQLELDETVFLHPPGIDAQCDEARRSLPP
jgi:aminoglycoside N3'-acetyltransferase